MKKPRILMLITEYLPIFSGHAIYSGIDAEI